MNNIRKINLTDNSVIIESGCILEDLKKNTKHDMEFPDMDPKAVVKLEVILQQMWGLTIFNMVQ